MPSLYMYGKRMVNMTRILLRERERNNKETFYQACTVHLHANNEKSGVRYVSLHVKKVVTY